MVRLTKKTKKNDDPNHQSIISVSPRKDMQSNIKPSQFQNQISKKKKRVTQKSDEESASRFYIRLRELKGTIFIAPQGVLTSGHQTPDKGIHTHKTKIGSLHRMPNKQSS
jgi:hypothetical protein